MIDRLINYCDDLLTADADDEIDENDIGILNILFDDIICLPEIKDSFFY